MRFLPVNPHSLLVELADLNQTLALLESLQRDPIAGVLELVPAARTILVSFDPLRLSAEQAVAAMATRDVNVRVERASRLIEIPVDYEGEDLAEVAELLGVSPQEVVQRHTDSEYTVAFTGFAPGFAYLTGGDALLNVPRRKTPRTRIPAGAVGLAGTFSGVYPQASPGGWQIIGITPEAMWDIDRQPPALLQPGDRVRFVDQRLRPASKAPAATQVSAKPAAPAAAAPGVEIEIVSPGLQTLTQDLGRPGQAGQGVSASGAMDRQSLQLANRLVGNASDEVCLETVGGGLQLRSHGDAVIAITGAAVPVTLKDSTGRTFTLACHQPLALSAGDRLTLGVPRAGARAYVSVRGGWQVAPVLGSRATDTLANVGPAALAAGDRLAINPVTRGAIVQDAACSAHTLPAADDTVVLDVCMGPRTDWFTAEAVQTLCEQDWLVTPQSNRVGVRLAGEQSLTRAVEGELPSEGTPTGAIQVPPSGQPVLFLADHPLTGGYPVIACVAPYHLDLAGQIPVGARVRFNPIKPFAEWPAPAQA